ncbi:hypothetical protein IH575_00315 [Candidatus Dojkabacteria bacterium]|nr:hypothetical protein [Candidatus Dojkabacteria bacterium]
MDEQEKLKELQKVLDEDYNNIMKNLNRGIIKPLGYELNMKKRRDAVVAAFHLGIMMSKFYNLDTKVGDQDVSLSSMS